MKKEYIKPSTMAIELQHKAQLMTVSGEVSNVQTTGWEEPDDDKLIISNQSANISIWDR